MTVTKLKTPQSVSKSQLLQLNELFLNEEKAPYS